tara:strand:+ start:99 stop:1022 length:924 start_codon:yes stop_codon:yes gene_type:complete
MEEKKIRNRNYWKKEDENLLKQWADKAQCYQWLHNKSRAVYQRKNAWYTIPVIIISTITGTANFAQERFSDEIKPYVVISIGTLSIIAGIITTIYQFLKISEINEGHRIATLSWGKFHRNLEAELTRHPLDRMKPIELMNISKEEYNRLIEISPQLDNKILKLFSSKFKKNTELTKPEIGNTINSINVFTLDEVERKKMVDEINNDVNNKKLIELKKEKKQLTQIEKFKLNFRQLHNREPTTEEINKNMQFIKNDEDIDLSDNSNNNLEMVETNEDQNIELIISNETQESEDGTGSGKSPTSVQSIV